MHHDVFQLALVDLDNLVFLLCLVVIFSFYMVLIMTYVFNLILQQNLSCRSLMNLKVTLMIKEVPY